MKRGGVDLLIHVNEANFEETVSSSKKRDEIRNSICSYFLRLRQEMPFIVKSNFLCIFY